MIASCELPPTAKNLVVTTPRTSRFYVLPKIPKPNNPGRALVPACCCPAENISAYNYEVMAPFVKQLPSYVKGTNHVLSIFDSSTFDASDQRPCFLFTMENCCILSSPTMADYRLSPISLTKGLLRNLLHTPWFARRSWYWPSMPFPLMTNTTAKLVELPWVVKWGPITWSVCQTYRRMDPLRVHRLCTSITQALHWWRSRSRTV